MATMFAHTNFTWDNVTIAGSIYVSPNCSGVCESFHDYYLTDHPIPGTNFRALESWMKMDDLNPNLWYLLYPMGEKVFEKHHFPGCKVYHDEVDFHRLKCSSLEALQSVANSHEEVKYLMSLPTSLEFVDARHTLMLKFSRYTPDNPYRKYFQDRNLQTPAYPGVMVTDTGLDYSHCSFFDPARQVPVLGGFSSTAHSKILGILRGEYGDYIALNNAHGTATASLVNGAPCGEFEGGACQACKLAFLDIAIGDSSLIVPYHLKTISEDLHRNYGVRVHSMSWGDTSNGGRYTTLSYLIDDIAFSNPGLIHVAAAGNTGPAGRVIPPATAKNVISVGSVGSFSSVGPLLDGRPAPVLVYGGVDVYTAAARYPIVLQNHENFNSVDGTSFSAPVIGAMIAAMEPSFFSHYGYWPEFGDVQALVQVIAPPFTSFSGHYHTADLPLNTELCFSFSDSQLTYLSFAWLDVPSTRFPNPTEFRYAFVINDISLEMIPGNRVVYALITQKFNLSVVSLKEGTQPKVALHINRAGVSTCQGDGLLSQSELVYLRQESGIVASSASRLSPKILFTIILLSFLNLL